MTVFIIYSDGDVTIYLSSNKQGMTSSSIFFWGWAWFTCHFLECVLKCTFMFRFIVESHRKQVS